MTTSPDELCQEAYRRYQAGDPITAERLCWQLLALEPRQSAAVYLLGVLAQDAGKLEQAAELIRQATHLAPDNAVFVNAFGEIQLLLGRHAEAESSFRKARALRPGYERAYNNLGRMCHLRGDLAEARGHFTEAVRLNPQYATAHNNLGAVLQSQNELDNAAVQFQLALQLRPDYPEAHFNLGTTWQARGDPVTAAGHFREAIRLRPHYARAHFHLGQVLEQQRQDYAALACYQSAARLQPEDADLQRRLGDLLLLKKDWPEALAALEKAAALQPQKPEPFARLVYGRQLVCAWQTYPADLERLTADADRQLADGEACAVVPFQALTLPWPRARLGAIARSHCAALVRQQQERQLQPYTNHAWTRSGRLRIGYVSSDFYDHPIAHLLHGLFGRHDRAQFEIFAYSFGVADTSVYRQRIINECEHFVEVGQLSIPALARRVADDGVHILVDLMGHTGVNRLGVLALRPAPLQVSLLGMLGTMGADFIDYLITDRHVTPSAFAPEFTEKFVTMPHSYLIAEPEATPHQGEVRRADHGLPEQGFVYCSFNNSYKLEPRMFGVWMNILSAVPGSVLWLVASGAVMENNLRREAAARGVGGERLVFAGFRPRPEHLQRQRAADLFLDTLHYQAAATASLALQSDLPVLTCPGDTFASRVGASLLQAVGLPELIAPDLEQYERRAIELAQQPDELRRLRAKLAAQRPTAPLFDTPRYVRNLERAYLAMWDHFAAGGSPQPIEVCEPESEKGMAPCCRAEARK